MESKNLPAISFISDLDQSKEVTLASFFFISFSLYNTPFQMGVFDITQLQIITGFTEIICIDMSVRLNKV